jgi:hypothetical protein
MAQHYLNNNRRTSTANNQIAQDSYEYDVMKLMERERQYIAAQVCVSYQYSI